MNIGKWELRWRPGFSASSDYPSQVITIGANLQSAGLAPEIAMLLPTNASPRSLIKQIMTKSYAGQMLGLFLADPFFQASRDIQQIAGSGINWVCNLPSTEQQDIEFSSKLAEVGLDTAREIHNLHKFRDHGFKIALTLADPKYAQAAAKLAPNLIFVLPRIADFSIGFPSLRQRNSAVKAVAEGMKKLGWQGPLLCLGEKTELDYPNQFSPAVDAILCRPQIQKTQ